MITIFFTSDKHLVLHSTSLLLTFGFLEREINVFVPSNIHFECCFDEVMRV